MAINEIPLLFFHAIRLDLAAVSYIAGLPILLWIINQYISNKSIVLFNRIFIVTILPIAGFIMLMNLIVFQAWGTIINARAISFLSSPTEVFASMTSLQIVIAILLILLLSIGIIKFYDQFTSKSFSTPSSSKKHFVWLWILVLPIFIRGGIQQIPINESVCMFSKNENTNLATINPFWYLLNSLFKSQNIDKNAYHFIDDNLAKQNYEKLYYGKSDSCLTIIANSKPNIITIVLESWTADVIQSMGGEKGVTPFFNSLENEGLLFDHIYAAGKRTDLMFPSLFSGFPAMPNISVIKYSDKTIHLPFITHSIKKQGYQTSFNYGGELEFANMKSYLTQAAFDVIQGKESFPIEKWTSKWGVYDEELFDKSLSSIHQLKQPFFSVILTQSTHEPFAIPIPPKFQGTGESVKFKNAAYYTDCCLKLFFEKIKNEPWYNNTLILLVADHGHILPRNRDYSEQAAFRIPLLITGPALKSEYLHKRISNIGNQQDYAATMKSILNLQIDLPFSNNLLNINRTNFCYMNFDNGFNWKTDHTTIKYNYSSKSAQPLENPIDSTDIHQGWSFIQSAYQYFVKL
ncbi:MAG: LTA synthase family protein [Bacteroidota bacterium]